MSAALAYQHIDTKPGAGVYSFTTLNIYDIVVLGFSSTYAWGASTKAILEPFFTANFTSCHLDIGPGTGYFPATALDKTSSGRDDVSLTLVDLNNNCLVAANERIGRPEITKCVVADALQPMPEEVGTYDSISLTYLLHCLPGPPEFKVQIFGNVKKHLAPGGTLFGFTVLGEGVTHNWLGRTLMWIYNSKGIFDNTRDSEEVFVEALKSHFAQVESRVVGRVLLFKAWDAK